MKQQCHTITKNQNVSSPDLQAAISKETRVGKYGRIIKVKHTFLLRSSNVWKLNWKAFLLARQYTCPVFPWIHLFNVCAIIFSIFNTSTLRVDDANNFPFPLQQQKEAKIRKKKKSGLVWKRGWKFIQTAGESSAIIMPLPELTHDCIASVYISFPVAFYCWLHYWWGQTDGQDDQDGQDLIALCHWMTGCMARDCGCQGFGIFIYICHLALIC